MVDVSYQKSCVKNSRTCSPEEHIAAVYDYVGALYGEEGNVNFDGTLTDAEKSYVVEKFGELTNLNGKAYIQMARFEFMIGKTDGSDFVACDKNVDSHSYSSDALGFVRAVVGMHNCLSVYLRKFPIEDELAIASSPDSWLFFIEGYDPSLEPGAPEFYYFYRLANILGIQVFDPTPFTINSPEVIEETAYESGYSEIELLSALLAQDIIAAQEEGNFNSKKNQIVARYNRLAQTLGYKEEDLSAALSSYMIRHGNDLERMREDSNEKILLLVQYSNRHSKEVVRETLFQHRDLPAPFKTKFNSLFIMGGLHLDMLRDLYK